MQREGPSQSRLLHFSLLSNVNGYYRPPEGFEEYSKANTRERAEREESRCGYVLLAAQGNLRLSRGLSGGKTH